jgi:hypothetical protein
MLTIDLEPELEINLINLSKQEHFSLNELFNQLAKSYLSQKQTETQQKSNPLNIKNRLEELAQLQNGWLDGKGIAPNRESLLWLSKEFETKFSPSLPLPYLYPTAEGGIQAEWSLKNDWEISLEINLDSKQAQWQAFNLITEQCDEYEWDLGSSESWQTLNQTLQALLPKEAA